MRINEQPAFARREMEKVTGTACTLVANACVCLSQGHGLAQIYFLPQEDALAEALSLARALSVAIGKIRDVPA